MVGKAVEVEIRALVAEALPEWEDLSAQQTDQPQRSQPIAKAAPKTHVLFLQLPVQPSCSRR